MIGGGCCHRHLKNPVISKCVGLSADIISRSLRALRAGCEGTRWYATLLRSSNNLYKMPNSCVPVCTEVFLAFTAEFSEDMQM